MRVSTQFPIAVHTLLMIAREPEKRITSDMVSSSAGCNAVIVRNIFSKLKKASLLSIKTGTGGILLLKPLNEITLWDIYSAVETDETNEIFRMHPHTSESCPIGSQIHSLLLAHLDDAVNAMKDELSSVTLASLINELTLTAPIEIK